MQVPTKLWPAGLRIVTQLNKRRKVQLAGARHWVEQIQDLLSSAVTGDLDLSAFQDATAMRLECCVVRDIDTNERVIMHSSCGWEPHVLQPTEQSALICACKAERITATCKNREVWQEDDDGYCDNDQADDQTFITVNPL